jgi:streptogramin lyase
MHAVPRAPWVVAGSGGSITRVYPSNNTPNPPVSVLTGLAAAGGLGSIWIGSGSGVLSRVDANKGSVIATIPTGSQANAVAIAFGSVWTTDYQAGTLLRIDPSSNVVIARIPLGGLPGAIVAGGNWLWTLSLADGSIARVDPTSNQVVGTVASVEGRQDVAFANGALYAVGAPLDTVGATQGVESGYIERIDPGNLQVVAHQALAGGAFHISPGSDALWVSLSSEDVIVRVDPVSLLTLASIGLSGQPQGLAVDEHSAWVAVDTPDGLVRIATGN